MIEKKRPLWVIIVGWVIIVSNIVTSLFSYFFAGLKLSGYSLFLYNLVGAIAIFPRGFPWLFAQFSSQSTLVYILTLCWMIVAIICSYGILRFKNNTRVTFIILNAIHILTFIISRFGIHIKFSISTFGMLMYISTLIIPVAYIIFFTRPKVKALFSPPEPNT